MTAIDLNTLNNNINENELYEENIVTAMAQVATTHEEEEFISVFFLL